MLPDRAVYYILYYCTILNPPPPHLQKKKKKQQPKTLEWEKVPFSGKDQNRLSLSSSLKEVAEANFTLHEMHCKRFLCLCPDCNETIPKEHLSQHREEQHTQVYTVCTHTTWWCNLWRFTTPFVCRSDAQNVTRRWTVVTYKITR